MQEEPSLEELIERLRVLNIESARVNSETARTVELIRQAQRREQRRQARATIIATATVATPVYQVGERVTVINTRSDRQATVTRVTNNRVYIRTDGGQHTWRAPHNLRPEAEDNVR